MEGGARVRGDCRVLTVEDRRRTGSKSVGSREQGSLIEEACADGGTRIRNFLVTVAPHEYSRTRGWAGAAALLPVASDREGLMALKLEEKKVVVAEVNAVAAKALSVVGAENRGLTVSQMTDLRAKARKEGVYLRVVKNTLARKAVAGTAFECISPALKGPVVLAFSNDDPGAAARIVKAFSKDNDKLVTTLVSLGGQMLKPQDLDRVASLPTRAQAVSLLLGVLQAPIAKLVGTLAAPHAKLVRTIAAVAEAKKSAAA